MCNLGEIWTLIAWISEITCSQKNRCIHTSLSLRIYAWKAAFLYLLLVLSSRWYSLLQTTIHFYRAMLRRARYCYSKLSVRLSATLTYMYRDNIGWNSSKIISYFVSLGCLLSTDPNFTDLLQREQPKILAVTYTLLNWASQIFDGKLRPNG